MLQDSEVFGLGIFFGAIIFGALLYFVGITPAQMENKYRKEAISHGAAYYEVDTNGIVTFKWKEVK